ncbi:MAG TPA: hypothetical protein VH144_02850 [Candidatus Saccharimonadales bacterium]|jgi:hypothetical protein|nr:hypothetical protein [Candidatus Saccharimonadales bacterium]
MTELLESPPQSQPKPNDKDLQELEAAFATTSAPEHEQPGLPFAETDAQDLNMMSDTELDKVYASAQDKLTPLDQNRLDGMSPTDLAQLVSASETVSNYVDTHAPKLVQQLHLDEKAAADMRNVLFESQARQKLNRLYPTDEANTQKQREKAADLLLLPTDTLHELADKQRAVAELESLRDNRAAHDEALKIESQRQTTADSLKVGESYPGKNGTHYEVAKIEYDDDGTATNVLVRTYETGKNHSRATRFNSVEAARQYMGVKDLASQHLEDMYQKADTAYNLSLQRPEAEFQPAPMAPEHQVDLSLFDDETEPEPTPSEANTDSKVDLDDFDYDIDRLDDAKEKLNYLNSTEASEANEKKSKLSLFDRFRPSYIFATYQAWRSELAGQTTLEQEQRFGTMKARALGAAAMVLTAVVAYGAIKGVLNGDEHVAAVSATHGPGYGLHEIAQSTGVDHTQISEHQAQVMDHIHSGEGGYELASKLGKTNEWWNNHANALIEKFPKDFYRMNSGGAGIAHPGALGDAAQRYIVTH